MTTKLIAVYIFLNKRLKNTCGVRLKIDSYKWSLKMSDLVFYKCLGIFIYGINQYPKAKNICHFTINC